MIVTGPTRSGVEVVLEVAVVAGHLDHSLERGRRQGGAPQVGVHDDTGGVEHASQVRAAPGLEQVRGLGGKVGRLAGSAPVLAVGTVQDAASGRLERRPQCLHHLLPRISREKGAHVCAGEQIVDSRQTPQCLPHAIVQTGLPLELP